MKGIEEFLFWIKINLFFLLIALGRSGLCKYRVGFFYLYFLSKAHRYDFVTGAIFLQYSDFYSQTDCTDRELFWNNLFFNFYSGRFVSTDKFLQCHQGKWTWADRVQAEDLTTASENYSLGIDIYKNCNQHSFFHHVKDATLNQH